MRRRKQAPSVAAETETRTVYRLYVLTNTCVMQLGARGFRFRGSKGRRESCRTCAIGNRLLDRTGFGAACYVIDYRVAPEKIHRPSLVIAHKPPTREPARYVPTAPKAPIDSGEFVAAGSES